jgi:ABC-type nitrate/sulfonate/bicarbonate transport system ATPase subunit
MSMAMPVEWANSDKTVPNDGGPGTAADAAPGLLFEDISFSYGQDIKVLDHISVTVPKGRVLGIVGPSGCGKSTLLAIAASLLQPTGGRFVQFGHTPGRHALAMVFQKDTLLPWLTTAENIGLSFKFRGSHVARNERKTRIADLVQLAGLQGFEDKYPYQLSGGMRRRVAFLSAVAPMPEILLLDEPFSSLDEPTRVAIHQDIFDIVNRLGMTVILVTHDLAEAISLCDEVAILTRRPSHVYSTHSVNFGRQRTMLHLRQERSFLDLYGSLWEQLSLQLEARPAR